MIQLPNPFSSVALTPLATETAAAPSPPASAGGAAANQSTVSEGRSEQAPAAVALNPPETAGALASEEYIPELFSVFAARRCMPKVSPPVVQPERKIEDLIDWDALYDAALPPEPPVFLRNPRPAFLRALFELSR